MQFHIKTTDIQFHNSNQHTPENQELVNPIHKMLVGYISSNTTINKNDYTGSYGTTLYKITNAASCNDLSINIILLPIISLARKKVKDLGMKKMHAN